MSWQSQNDSPSPSHVPTLAPRRACRPICELTCCWARWGRATSSGFDYCPYFGGLDVEVEKQKVTCGAYSCVYVFMATSPPVEWRPFPASCSTFYMRHRTFARVWPPSTSILPFKYTAITTHHDGDLAYLQITSTVLRRNLPPRSLAAVASLVNIITVVYCKLELG